MSKRTASKIAEQQGGKEQHQGQIRLVDGGDARGGAAFQGAEVEEPDKPVVTPKSTRKITARLARLDSPATFPVVKTYPKQEKEVQPDLVWFTFLEEATSSWYDHALSGLFQEGGGRFLVNRLSSKRIEKESPRCESHSSKAEKYLR